MMGRDFTQKKKKKEKKSPMFFRNSVYVCMDMELDLLNS